MNLDLAPEYENLIAHRLSPFTPLKMFFIGSVLLSQLSVAWGASIADRPSWCIDDNFYRDRFGLGCKAYIEMDCMNMHLVGFSQSQIDDLLKKCPASCQACSQYSPTLSPTFKPTQNFEQLGNSNSCVDDIEYIGPLGLTCLQHVNINCHAMGYAGLSASEVIELFARCSKSCGLCTEVPTAAVVYTEEPTYFPTYAPIATPLTSQPVTPKVSPPAVAQPTGLSKVKSTSKPITPTPTSIPLPSTQTPSKPFEGEEVSISPFNIGLVPVDYKLTPDALEVLTASLTDSLHTELKNLFPYYEFQVSLHLVSQIVIVGETNIEQSKNESDASAEFPAIYLTFLKIQYTSTVRILRDPLVSSISSEKRLKGVTETLRISFADIVIGGIFDDLRSRTTLVDTLKDGHLGDFAALDTMVLMPSENAAAPLTGKNTLPPPNMGLVLINWKVIFVAALTAVIAIVLCGGVFRMRSKYDLSMNDVQSVDGRSTGSMSLKSNYSMKSGYSARSGVSRNGGQIRNGTRNDGMIKGGAGNVKRCITPRSGSMAVRNNVPAPNAKGLQLNTIVSTPRSNSSLYRSRSPGLRVTKGKHVVVPNPASPKNQKPAMAPALRRSAHSLSYDDRSVNSGASGRRSIASQGSRKSLASASQASRRSFHSQGNSVQRGAMMTGQKSPKATQYNYQSGQMGSHLQGQMTGPRVMRKNRSNSADPDERRSLNRNFGNDPDNMTEVPLNDSPQRSSNDMDSPMSSSHQPMRSSPKSPRYFRPQAASPPGSPGSQQTAQTSETSETFGTRNGSFSRGNNGARAGVVSSSFEPQVVSSPSSSNITIPMKQEKPINTFGQAVDTAGNPYSGRRGVHFTGQAGENMKEKEWKSYDSRDARDRQSPSEDHLNGGMEMNDKNNLQTSSVWSNSFVNDSMDYNKQNGQYPWFLEKLMDVGKTRLSKGDSFFSN